MSRYLKTDEARLYDLIWKRSVASQMASADVEQTTVDIDVGGRDGKPYGFRASGSVIQFDGFLKLYEEGRDDKWFRWSLIGILAVAVLALLKLAFVVARRE